MLGGAAAWIADRFNKHYARNISLVAVLIAFAVAMGYTAANYVQITSSNASLWLIDYKLSWIPAFGISFHLAMDGLSLIMVLLTLFLGVLSVLISWKEIKDRTGFYYFNLLWILAGIIGVFTAVDLFLFYFFWEIMLIPMYFLIGIWGHERKIYAAYKFFIYTQASGLLMFLAILGLYFVHGKTTGVYSFDYFDLLGTKFEPTMGFLLMSGFLVAFTVKLPIVPLHNWLPDAHTQAPTAGSLILAGLLLKTGAYGIIRFAIPFFPDAAHVFAPYGMIIGTIGILYGAKLAFSQTDLKRLVAYTSVSHMGFVMLGVWAFNELAYQGVVMQMVTHGISTGALFILVGFLYERTHTRDINSFGGLWAQVPKLGTMMLIFALASLGLPGLGNFIAEFLVLAGSYQANMIVTAIASIGLVLGTVYSLRIFQRVFQGPKIKEWTMPDLSWRETIVIGSLVLVILWLGLYPQPVIDTVKPVIANVLGYL
jgi:NADH-quinone oxidoreductase subunit M